MADSFMSKGELGLIEKCPKRTQNPNNTKKTVNLLFTIKNAIIFPVVQFDDGPLQCRIYNILGRGGPRQNVHQCETFFAPFPYKSLISFQYK
jgi:hypothetical protein